MDLTDVTLDQLYELRLEVQAEIERRQVPMQMDQLLRQSLAGEGVTSGDPWRQPTGAHDAYPMGWVVTHGDKMWESMLAGNVWEPPQGWREMAGPGEYPAWVRPLGAMDAYPLGAEVSHNDALWRSTVEENVWEPGIHGWDEFGGPEVEPYPAWVQPLGAEDAYPLGAEVSHNDALWRSNVDDNVWEPGVHGWDEFNESDTGGES